MLGGLLATLASLLASLSPPPAGLPPPTPAPEPAVAPEPAIPPAPPPTETPAPVPEPPPVVESTAYCLTGRMANGSLAHVGAVASNRHPLGTHLWLEDSPWGPGEFVVQDRIGHGSALDIAMPGDCRGARRWGRRSVGVSPV